MWRARSCEWGAYFLPLEKRHLRPTKLWTRVPLTGPPPRVRGRAPSSLYYVPTGHVAEPGQSAAYEVGEVRADGDDQGGR